jgi:PAS domain S-box-containing protein
VDISWFYTTVVGIIISLSALITAIGIIYNGINKLRKWLSGRVKSMVGYRGIIERQDVLESKIDRILNELTHNGGHSTKDVVRAVSESVIRLESRQQAMLDAMSHGQGMFECTVFGEFLWTNKTLCYILQKPSQDLIGKGWIGSVAYRHREGVIDEFDDCLDQQREFHLKFNMVRQDGKEIYVEMKTTKMADHSGKQMGYFGTIVNLDENE